MFENQLRASSRLRVWYFNHAGRDQHRQPHGYNSEWRHYAANYIIDVDRHFPARFQAWYVQPKALEVYYGNDCVTFKSLR